MLRPAFGSALRVVRRLAGHCVAPTARRNLSGTAASAVVVNKNPIVPRPLNGRVPVADPSLFPSRSVGHILVVRRDNEQVVWTAVGTLASDRTVVTAASAIVKRDHGLEDFQHALDLRFDPALHHGSSPYGTFHWSKIRIVGGVALISLTSPAGHSLGFLPPEAQLPISRWQKNGDVFTYLGLRDGPADTLWVDAERRCVGTQQRHLLIGDLSAQPSLPGGPLLTGWPLNPRLVGLRVSRPNWDLGHFIPGWEEDDTSDSWFDCLRELARKHADDRLGWCDYRVTSREPDGRTGAFDVQRGVLPLYDLPGAEVIKESGPSIRYSPGPRLFAHAPDEVHSDDEGTALKMK